jgi:hypothetical protein
MTAQQTCLAPLCPPEDRQGTIRAFAPTQVKTRKRAHACMYRFVCRGQEERDCAPADNKRKQQAQTKGVRIDMPPCGPGETKMRRSAHASPLDAARRDAASYGNESEPVTTFESESSNSDTFVSSACSSAFFFSMLCAPASNIQLHRAGLLSPSLILCLAGGPAHFPSGQLYTALMA